ncbi:hypothetical protein FC778_13450 [Clostridium botulinum]|nr:hypothetical protein [Clostridium botulinum]
MKPILFNTVMIQAILEGRKTCTRRVAKGLKDATKVTRGDFKWDYNNSWMNDLGLEIKAPFHIGDILYVRETWKQYEKRVGQGEHCCLEQFYGYKADEDKPGNPSEFYEGNWKPSIHMPKDAARIFLKVTNVRVERLDQMIIADCLSEGIRAYTKDDKLYKYAVNDEQYTWRNMPHNPHQAFKDLWDSTLKKDQLEQYGFNANPYVWVIEFERCEKPNE